MNAFCQNLLTASIHGSIVILAVMLLRLVLKRTPRKYICFLWMLAGIRLLMPISVQSAFSLQPSNVTLPAISSKLVWILWACAAAVIVLVSLSAYLRLQKQVKDAVAVPGGYESDKIETAFVLGFIKPKIYIPSGMSQSARKQILAHERTHLEKGDHWIKMIAFIALALHWFNPLVWVAYLMLCKDIEIACDERVVQFMELGERKAYASALLQCSTNQVYYAACPVAFGEVSVKYRIQSALHYRKPAFWMSLLGVMAVAFVTLCLLTNPAQAASNDQAELQRSSSQTPESVALPTMPELEPNPDWGVTMYLDATSPTGGYLACIVEERFIQSSENIAVDNVYLERWDGIEWERVPGPDPYYSLAKIRIGFAASRDCTVSDYGQDVDWSLSYGALPAGDYRAVMTVGSDTDSATFQTSFHIYRETLPDEEENALTRCANALSTLTSNSYYSVLLSEESPDGNLQPVMHLLRNGTGSSITHFYGEFQVSQGETSSEDPLFSQWESTYRLDQNRKFLFPVGKSKISQEEITFLSVWADFSGKVHHGTDTFRFKTDGTLDSIERLDETIGEDGSVSGHVRNRMEVVKASNYLVGSVSTYEPQDSFVAMQRSPWSIFFRVDDDLLKGYGGEVWLGVNLTGVSKITTDCTYRMGKHFYQEGDSIIQYAEFSIPLAGGIHGEGGEEALARVDAAIEALKQKGFRMEKYQCSGNSYFSNEDLDEVIWRYDGSEVYDFYGSQGYRHSVADSDVMFESWAKRSYWNEPYDSYYFSKDYSVISDREIRFAHSFSQSSAHNTLEVYTYLFDETGSLCEIDVDYRYYDGQIGTASRYVVTDTPESEIKTWVEKVKAEQ